MYCLIEIFDMKAQPADWQLYPWFKAQWETWAHQVRSDHLPHALLLAGVPGIGKRHLATQFSRFLLCQNPTENNLPCGKCKNCQLSGAGSHPDYLFIDPQEGSRAVKVDQIRQLTEFVQSTPQISLRRVAIIVPAETMNLFAANALLKTLEEPPSATTIILVSQQLSLLLPTIRSRCQIAKFGLPPSKQASDWLSEHGGLPIQEAEKLLEEAAGQPLTALAWSASQQADIRKEILAQWVGYLNGSEDAFSVAEKWTKLDTEWLLNWLGGWLRDLLKARQDAQFSPPISEKVAQKWSSETICYLFQELLEIKRNIVQQRNLNLQLVLEHWLLLNKKRPDYFVPMSTEHGFDGNIS